MSKILQYPETPSELANPQGLSDLRDMGKGLNIGEHEQAAINSCNRTDSARGTRRLFEDETKRYQ